MSFHSVIRYTNHLTPSVHQLFYLAAHWLLFGEAYRDATLTAAEQILVLSPG